MAAEPKLGTSEPVRIAAHSSRQDRVVTPVVIRDRKVTRIHCYALLALSDICAIVLPFVLANFVVSLQAPAPIEHGFVMLSALLPLFAVQALTNATYGAQTLENPTLGAGRAVRALSVAGAVVLLIAYLLKASGEFSRGVFLMGFAASFVLLIVARKVLHPYVMHILAGAAHTTIVVRDTQTYIPQGPEIVLSAADLGFDPSTRDPRAYHNFAAAVACADRVIVACDKSRAAAWASVLRTMAIDGEILTGVRDEIGAVGMRDFGERKTLLINHGPLTFSARITKRLFDIVFSALAILVSSPVLILAALIIKLESKGPVFFRQERIGCDNRIFRIFKFRSMYVHSTDEHGSKLTEVGDPRVTRFGAFIRGTSIDELPQLFNVLRGEMSIVGPRPHALAAKAANVLYWDVDERYRQRHVIKPGMTGLAQVRGFRGNTHQITDLANRLQSDLEYVANWSLRGDLLIILKTMKVVLHSNAY